MLLNQILVHHRVEVTVVDDVVDVTIHIVVGPARGNGLEMPVGMTQFRFWSRHVFSVISGCRPGRTFPSGGAYVPSSPRAVRPPRRRPCRRASSAPENRRMQDKPEAWTRSIENKRKAPV